MAQAKRAPSQNNLRKFRDELESGNFHNLYVFHGEERYLLEYYLGELRKKTVAEGMEDFNYFAFDGGSVDMDELGDAVEALPAFSERKLVVVTDLDLYKPGADRKEKLEALVADIPEYTVLVFVYDTVEYKTDARAKIHKLLGENALVVEFLLQGDSELVGWLRRRFRALGKDIDMQTAEHMLFVCGRSMTLLVNEVEKVAAYASLDRITESDIDASCAPIADAVVFSLADAVAAGKYAQALELERDLVSMRNDPVYLVGVLSRQMRQLLYGRIALDSRRGQDWFMRVADTPNPYAARRQLDLARRVSTKWSRAAMKLCVECDYELKTSAADRSALLETLLLRIAALEK